MDNGTGESYQVWAFRDRLGLTCIGKIRHDPNEPIAIIEDPLFVNENLERTGDPRTANVNFGFTPVLHTYHIEQLDVEWVAKFPVPQDMATAYEDTWNQIRAKRSGIITSVGTSGIRAPN